jgi:hypothetical protein
MHHVLVAVSNRVGKNTMLPTAALLTGMILGSLQLRLSPCYWMCMYMARGCQEQLCPGSVTFGCSPTARVLPPYLFSATLFIPYFQTCFKQTLLSELGMNTTGCSCDSCHHLSPCNSRTHITDWLEDKCFWSLTTVGIISVKSLFQ